jgi:protein-L-isoaspartate(D-aspartate) O-methyltransferase
MNDIWEKPVNPSPWVEARREMVRVQIAGRGIKDPRVLAAMERLPREHFVAPAHRSAAYEDRALPNALGQTISQPYIVAYMTEALALGGGMKVLEVGTGSGYQCALLSMLGGRVHTIEREAELSKAARSAIRTVPGVQLGPIAFHVGDGSVGLPEEAPFDRILVTAAAPQVPQALVEQLPVGGRLVIPVGDTDHQVIVCVDRFAGRTVEKPGLACRFVKLIGSQGWGSSDEPPASEEA